VGDVWWEVGFVIELVVAYVSEFGVCKCWFSEGFHSWVMVWEF